MIGEGLGLFVIVCDDDFAVHLGRRAIGDLTTARTCREGRHVVAT
jgi:hypothetical protein